MIKQAKIRHPQLVIINLKHERYMDRILLRTSKNKHKLYRVIYLGFLFPQINVTENFE